MAIHPHMARIIAFYDLLIYSYYSPVWNRNAEGKLQPPKEEKEEEEKEMMMMMMMMMMKMEEKKREKMNWVQVN